MPQDHQLSLHSDCICVGLNGKDPQALCADCSLSFRLVLRAVCVDVGRTAGEGAQVTTVKLSHMGWGGLALTGASGLLMPTFSGCFHCCSSSADCTGSCRISLFYCTSIHVPQSGCSCALPYDAI